MGKLATSITYDPYAQAWRRIEPWELSNLLTTEVAAKRGARWPLSARVGGRFRHWFGTHPSILPQPNAGLLVPEVFSPAVALALPRLFAIATGPRVALFHDAIALRLPELAPPKTVGRFPAYMHELLAFDGIAAVSEDSRRSLLDYWKWLGVTKTPFVRTLPLGIGIPPLSDRPMPTSPVRPVVLSIGSIEGRKNHEALLEAADRLWTRGLDFELHLIGLAHPETGRVATERLRALQAAGRPLRYDGPTDDDTLEQAYAECAFTVYPSKLEGFGLPVFESVARGKPCICSSRGALGEAARWGGCLKLDSVDAESVASAMAQLISDPAELRRLSAEARQRPLRTWADYNAELFAWMAGLGRKKVDA